MARARTAVSVLACLLLARADGLAAAPSRVPIRRAVPRPGLPSAADAALLSRPSRDVGAVLSVGAALAVDEPMRPGPPPVTDAALPGAGAGIAASPGGGSREEEAGAEAPRVDFDGRVPVPKPAPTPASEYALQFAAWKARFEEFPGVASFRRVEYRRDGALRSPRKFVVEFVDETSRLAALSSLPAEVELTERGRRMLYRIVTRARRDDVPWYAGWDAGQETALRRRLWALPGVAGVDMVLHKVRDWTAGGEHGTFVVRLRDPLSLGRARARPESIRLDGGAAPAEFDYYPLLDPSVTLEQQLAAYRGRYGRLPGVASFEARLGPEAGGERVELVFTHRRSLAAARRSLPRTLTLTRDGRESALPLVPTLREPARPPREKRAAAPAPGRNASVEEQVEAVRLRYAGRPGVSGFETVRGADGRVLGFVLRFTDAVSMRAARRSMRRQLKLREDGASRSVPLWLGVDAEGRGTASEAAAIRRLLSAPGVAGVSRVEEAGGLVLVAMHADPLSLNEARLPRALALGAGRAARVVASLDPSITVEEQLEAYRRRYAGPLGAASLRLVSGDMKKRAGTRGSFADERLELRFEDASALAAARASLPRKLSVTEDGRTRFVPLVAVMDADALAGAAAEGEEELRRRLLALPGAVAFERGVRRLDGAAYPSNDYVLVFRDDSFKRLAAGRVPREVKLSDGVRTRTFRLLTATKGRGPDRRDGQTHRRYRRAGSGEEDGRHAVIRSRAEARRAALRPALDLGAQEAQDGELDGEDSPDRDAQ